MLQISVGIPRMSGAHRRCGAQSIMVQYTRVSFLVMIKLVLIKMQLWYQDMRTKLGVQIYLIQVWMKLHSQQRC
ncbi:hypothetical protein AB205_0163970 [Aquarana catesbeiana]|uniref:Uncharacterized protein n=1 Tax=Aquarana catesbeiana TaxID=8400 RepID=A0A2G9RIP1_AQUCT|nr:hypothetical protein AB205_0163970 [Aquarana catesbeiana]